VLILIAPNEGIYTPGQIAHHRRATEQFSDHIRELVNAGSIELAARRLPSSAPPYEIARSSGKHVWPARFERLQDGSE
jgi:hypothetical protein